MRCPGRVIACVIALWGKVERWGLNAPLYLPSGCMDNSCPSICPFFTPFHDRSPSLAPLSSVAGGEVYAGSGRLRRLEAEWCQGEQVEQRARSEQLCKGLRRQMEEEIRRSKEAPRC